jgi:hypothetical protein
MTIDIVELLKFKEQIDLWYKEANYRNIVCTRIVNKPNHDSNKDGYDAETQVEILREYVTIRDVRSWLKDVFK